MARERDALYQADAPWNFAHPLEVAINCERLAVRERRAADRRAADRFLADAQWWLAKRDAALAAAKRS
jgi:hypothetical protein